MKYSTLKKERDEAIERAVEAERLSMKSEVDRIRLEHAKEKAELQAELNRMRIVVDAATAACEAQESGIKKEAWLAWLNLCCAVDTYNEPKASYEAEEVKGEETAA